MESSATTRDIISDFTCDQLCDFLVERHVNYDVIFTVRENFLVGRDFIDLTEDHLKELFPAVGSRMAVSRLVKSLQPDSRSSNSLSDRPPATPLPVKATKVRKVVQLS